MITISDLDFSSIQFENKTNLTKNISFAEFPDNGSNYTVINFC